MLTKTKTAIAAALVLASASAASAQSFDPSVGSGNLVHAVQTPVLQNAISARDLGAYAQVPSSTRNAGGETQAEKNLFDRIRPE